MIIRFAVQNFLSFRERQELSLVTSQLKDIDTGILISSAVKEKLLPSAVIWGANASGKSNFIEALQWMQHQVRFSHNRNRPTGKIPVQPFMLDSLSRDNETSFELDFILPETNVRYVYAFSATRVGFVREELTSFPNKRPISLFNRTPESIAFSKSLKGKNKTIADLMRENSLFLSAAAQNDHDELSKIAEYINRIVILVPSDPRFKSFHFPADDDINPLVIKFLNDAATGILAFRTREQDEVVSDKDKQFRAGMTKLLAEIHGGESTFSDMASIELKSIEFEHSGDGLGQYFLPAGRESTGTYRLLHLLIPIFDCLETGLPIFVDELDANLHTHAGQALLKLFNSPNSNPKGAQLIATTHNTNLLNSPFLRRDQKWLVEKMQSGASQLYPLTDYETRSTDNFERGYLEGRYGAVPNFDLEMSPE
jgi:AAA15 family ATPase/GTPase